MIHKYYKYGYSQLVHSGYLVKLCLICIHYKMRAKKENELSQQQ